MPRLTADLLRVCATFAVMLIHGTSFSQEPFRTTHSYFTSDFVAVVLGQTSRFSVPVFLLLSGYGLTLRYGALQRPGELRDFFRSRALRIALPFLVWTLALLFFQGHLFVQGPLLPAVGTAGLILGKSLLLGSADYHLYFFSIILQCYLLFPLLVRLPSWLLGLTLVPLLVFSIPGAGWVALLFGPLPALPSSLFVYWLAYFALGMVSARYAEQLLLGLTRLRIFVLLGSLVSWCLLIAEYVRASYGGQPAWAYDHFNRWTVIAFSLLVWALFFAYGRRLELVLAGRPRVVRLLGLLVAASFAAYLIHPWVLRGWLALLGSGPVLLLNGLLLGTTMLLTIGLERMLRRPKLLRLALGLPA